MVTAEVIDSTETRITMDVRDKHHIMIDNPALEICVSVIPEQMEDYVLDIYIKGDYYKTIYVPRETEEWKD